MSGGAFSDVVKARVMARSGGFCGRCGYPTPHGEYHHRRNRGMGGTSDMRAGQVSNALLLCRSCHLWVTDHKQEAMRDGHVVSNFCPDPSAVPVWRKKRWVLLTDDGGISPAEVPDD